MISIITPIYDIDEHLKDYAKFMNALMNKGGKKIVTEIILINNNPQKKISKTFITSLKVPRLIVIQNKKNIGYGSACNQGMRISKGKHMLILNPDVQIEAKSLKKLIQFIHMHKEVNIASCKLLNSDGSLQYSCRRFPTMLTLVARRVHFPLGYIFKKQLSRYNMEDYNHNTIKKVDWISGAVMLLRKKYYFDEQYFMYFEDLDLCRRVGGVFYNPSVYAIHKSERESARNIRLFLSHFKSMYQYYWKFI